MESVGFLSPFGAFRRMSDAGEVARFYRSFAATHSAGLPLVQSLDLFRGEPAVQRRVSSLREALARGGTLSDGARGAAFTRLEEALLRLGEETGRLDGALKGLAAFFEADLRVARKVKTKMAQPFITALAACFILPAPLAFRFGLSAYLAVALPMLGMVLFGSGVLLWLVFTWLRNQPRYAISRMLWALATAIEAGLPIQRAVQLAADALGPCRTATLLRAVPPAKWEGRPLSETLPEVCQLPRTVVSVLQTMERTGDTVTTLHWLAKNYEDGTLTVAS